MSTSSVENPNITKRKKANTSTTEMKNILIHLFNTFLEFNPKKSILKKKKNLTRVYYPLQ